MFQKLLLEEKTPKKPEKEKKGESFFVRKWAEILAHRVDRMDEAIQARFMHHVDGLSLDALEGKWQP